MVLFILPSLSGIANELIDFLLKIFFNKKVFFAPPMETRQKPLDGAYILEWADPELRLTQGGSDSFERFGGDQADNLGPNEAGIYFDVIQTATEFRTLSDLFRVKVGQLLKNPQ